MNFSEIKYLIYSQLMTYLVTMTDTVVFKCFFPESISLFSSK